MTLAVYSMHAFDRLMCTGGKIGAGLFDTKFTIVMTLSSYHCPLTPCIGYTWWVLVQVGVGLTCGVTIVFVFLLTDTHERCDLDALTSLIKKCIQLNAEYRIYLMNVFTLCWISGTLHPLFTRNLETYHSKSVMLTVWRFELIRFSVLHDIDRAFEPLSTLKYLACSLIQSFKEFYICMGTLLQSLY